ncbi:hypothetical protein [uncultured Roseobacter sp.]|uniref:hypothetical protein n=1 Tax=uncultured Roseobacter sp. TaxID=114847 RepID=UPI00261C4405|nr:hypothetical protein [uncultured Roseobacter sp.]
MGLIIRTGDIDLKADRLKSKAQSMERTYTNFALQKHEGTTYTAKEIRSLEQYTFTPPGIAKPVRVPGALKSPTDVHRLARFEARTRILGIQDRISDAATNMSKSGQTVSAGWVTQRRRGPSAQVKKLF